MLKLDILHWFLAFLPLLALLVTMMGLKWSAPKAGALAWIVAGLCGWLFFGADAWLLMIACAKGLSLSLFVLLIIWSSVFMYNLIERLGAMGVIGKSISRLASSRLGQALLLAWAFSGFIQGITGFGVPVAVVTVFMLMLGFSPITAAASVLIGHSWAVTFGSMASSYYTIQLVSGIPGSTIGPTMAIFFTLPIIATGFAVAHLEGGWRSIRKGALAILIVGVLMAFLVWAMAYLGAFQIASVVPGLVACGAIWLLCKTPLLKSESAREVVTNSNEIDNHLNFHLAFLPYYLLIIFTILSQLPPLKEAAAHLYWGANYPRLETSLGYVVEPAIAYAKISLLSHPAPLILASVFLTFLVFLTTGRWQNQAGITAFKATLRQSTPSTLSIATMVMMALIMMSTGMTDILAKGIASVTGAAFPVFSPFIGALGCFMTGSNTNSNVMFGALQVQTAQSLGISTVVIASAQSIGGSIGGAIAPAKVLVGSALVGLNGREGELMRKSLPYCLVIILLVGLVAWLATYIM